MYANDNFSFTFIHLYAKWSLSISLIHSLTFDYILFYCPPEQTRNKGDISYLYYTERKCIFKLFCILDLRNIVPPQKKAILWMMFLLKSHTNGLISIHIWWKIYICIYIVGKYVKDMNIYFTTISKHKKGIQFYPSYLK